MRKYIALVLALVCVLGLVGCKPDGTTDLIELGEVGAFVSEKGYTAEDFKEKLVGQFNEDIIRSWGEADIQFSGFWGHSWYLDDNNDKYISLYYDENGYVEEIVIGNRANQTANAIIADIVAEGIVSARFDSHIPNYIYDIEDLTIVDELLATLDGATYEVCERPSMPCSFDGENDADIVDAITQACRAPEIIKTFTEITVRNRSDVFEEQIYIVISFEENDNIIWYTTVSANPERTELYIDMLTGSIQKGVIGGEYAEKIFSMIFPNGGE